MSKQEIVIPSVIGVLGLLSSLLWGCGRYVVMRFLTPKNFLCSGIIICILIIWYHVMKLRELAESAEIPISLKTSAFSCPKSSWLSIAYKAGSY